MKILVLKLRIKAFTLIECLIGLLTISLTMLVVLALFKMNVILVNHLSNNNEQKWLVFCNLMDTELRSASFIAIEDNYLYVEQIKDNESKIIRFGKNLSQNVDDFRRTSETGTGYQPMLFEVEKSEIFQENQRIRIEITMKNRYKGVYYWYYKEKS